MPTIVEEYGANCNLYSLSMASSLIRINEATAEDLQRLKGIGPRRAEYIAAYREEIGPIRNVFDLATATGTSTKTAEKISNQIDWRHDGAMSRIQFWPLAITSLASLWLLAFSFIHLTSPVTTVTDGLYRLGLSLVLFGALITTADIMVASLRRQSSETTWLFLPGGVLFLLGFLLLSGLVGIGAATGLPGSLQQNLHHTFIFVCLTLLMIWLIYGPALCLRLLVGHSPAQIQWTRNLYDLSLLGTAAICICLLLFINGSTMLEEIFSVWSLVIITSNGLELMKGRPAFVAMLTNLDRGRYQFFLRHEVVMQPELKNYNKFIGSLALAAGTILLATLAMFVIK